MGTQKNHLIETLFEYSKTSVVYEQEEKINCTLIWRPVLSEALCVRLFSPGVSQMFWPGLCFMGLVKYGS